MYDRIPTRLAVLLGALAAVTLLAAAPAAAHVTASPPEHRADGYTVVTFGVPHGCEDNATLVVRIQMPEEIPTVTPTIGANWDIALVKEPLATPVEVGHGQMLEERVAEVVYTARTPLDPKQRDKIELSMKMPDLPGETLYFPTVQECENGTEAAWIELPAEGQDPFELDMPAPFVRLTGASGGHGGADTDDEDESGGGPAASTSAAGAEIATAPLASVESDSGTDPLAIVALVAAVLACALAAGALVSARKSGA